MFWWSGAPILDGGFGFLGRSPGRAAAGGWCGLWWLVVGSVHRLCGGVASAMDPELMMLGSGSPADVPFESRSRSLDLVVIAVVKRLCARSSSVPGMLLLCALLFLRRRRRGWCAAAVMVAMKTVCWIFVRLLVCSVVPAFWPVSLLFSSYLYCGVWCILNV